MGAGVRGWLPFHIQREINSHQAHEKKFREHFSCHCMLGSLVSLVMLSAFINTTFDGCSTLSAIIGTVCFSRMVSFKGK